MRPLVISGPSGVGKSTLYKILSDSHPQMFSTTISHTTRDARPKEFNGVNYFFVNEAKYLSMIEEKAFVEHAIFNGHHYGTSKQTIAGQSSDGSIVIVEIEMEGVKQMKADKSINARYVFIAPPSFETLEIRLRGRGTESDERIQARLTQAKPELKYAETSGIHDKIIVNDNLQQAYKDLEEFALRSTMPRLS